MQLEGTKKSDGRENVANGPLVPLPLDPVHKYNELIPFYAVNIQNFTSAHTHDSVVLLRDSGTVVFFFFFFQHIPPPVTGRYVIF